MPETGELVGRYRLVSQLGKGAMGEVWRARDERLDRYVALKILPPEETGDIEKRARQIREAKAAAAVPHPNVVTLFDVVSHEGNDFIIMELVEGKTLSETLRKSGPPELETALRWIEGVADALVAAHARGILHRDIKAANIMVTPTGVKVLDFGLAKLRDDTTTTSINRKPGASASMPSVSNTKIALDATMPSEPRSEALDRTTPTSLEIDSYKTHAGSLLGTPLYMAPEQIAGELPDERSEVFSVGVLGHEILAGKPPYNATSMDELFRQITSDDPPPIDDLPRPVIEILVKALAKERADRWQSMKEFRDALAAERAKRFAPPARRWPLAVAAGVVLAGAAVGLYLWRANQPEPTKPGDDLVTRALGEYDTFYNDKSLSSLRAALAVSPDHPRANAYLILFGGASAAEQQKAVNTAKRTIEKLPANSRDRVLLAAASTLVEKGPRAAREVFATSKIRGDHELAFWAAELDWRGGNYRAAGDGYKALLANPVRALRGRIYDHYSSVLLYLDDPAEALTIGTAYRDAFPGEADAVGVYATTLAAVGKLDEAVKAAEEARTLAEGEDTLAGLAKVHALRGETAKALGLYQLSLERSGASRRPVRRAALGMLHWLSGNPLAAIAAVAPCFPNGADAEARERGACLFVGGVIDPARADEAATQLDTLAAAATPTRPAYGDPAALAKLVRAKQTFFGGACLLPASASASPPDPVLASTYAVPRDFFAAYHVPFFATWAVCEHAALLAATGNKPRAAALLRPHAATAPWLRTALATYEK